MVLFLVISTNTLYDLIIAFYCKKKILLLQKSIKNNKQKTERGRSKFRAKLIEKEKANESNFPQESISS